MIKRAEMTFHRLSLRRDLNAKFAIHFQHQGNPHLGEAKNDRAALQEEGKYLLVQ